MSPQNIRNFCIIAHIDHGKSTLADRLLELTGTVDKGEIKEQFLDKMELEREKGITIKLKPVRMAYQSQGQDYILNLIDTPGHTDFSYEVERSLRVCEGALLLVDASQGVQAQTLVNFYLAQKLGLAIIPLINKIDLPNADIQRTKTELKELLKFSFEEDQANKSAAGKRDLNFQKRSAEILEISARTGRNVEKVLDKIISDLPAPLDLSSAQDNANQEFLGVIFDSFYDDYFGVVAVVRVLQGRIKQGEEICILNSEKTKFRTEEVGVFSPGMKEENFLKQGEVGYIKTGLKEITRCRVGNFLANEHLQHKALKLKKGKKYTPKQSSQSLVYSQFYPRQKADSQKLREALARLKLNDASLFFQPVHSETLGFGFNCGFLGLLHLEIIKERLRREFNLDVLLTQPMVEYHAHLKGGGRIVVHNAQELPEKFKIERIEEPITETKIFVPSKFLGRVMEVMDKKRGIYRNTEYLTEDQVVLTYQLPLGELISNTLNELKNISQGYASLQYKEAGYKEADLVKLEVRVHKNLVPALAQIVPQDRAQSAARKLASKLKRILPRQLFAVPIQVYSQGRIIAREDLRALSKDVIAKLYGGDRTRKDKLLKKQKKGKQRLASASKVEIPSEIFFEMLK